MGRLVALLLAAPLVAAVLSLALQPPAPVYRGPTGFSGERAYALLKTLTTEYKYRVVGSSADRRAAEWIAQYFRSLGLEVHVDEFTARSFSGLPAKAYNVYAVKQGAVNRYIVLVAHHDIVPTTVEGANDNGAGVAVLMELARVFANSTTRLGIVFLSTDAEETGLWGSKRFVRVFNGTLEAAISIDMCAWKSHSGVTLYSFGDPIHGLADLGLVYAVVKAGEAPSSARVVAVGWATLLARTIGSIGGTDSVPFLRLGVPALGLDDYPIYPYWHKKQDTLDKVSPQSLGEVGALVERVTRALAEEGVPRLGSQYIFVGNRAVYGPFLYAVCDSLLAASLAVTIKEVRRGASLRRAAKALAAYYAAMLVAAFSALALIPLVKSLLLSILAGSAVAAACAAIVGKRLRNEVRLSLAVSSVLVSTLGLANPALGAVFAPPIVYPALLARPVEGRARLAAKVAVPLVISSPALAILAFLASLAGAQRLDEAAAMVTGYVLTHHPLLALAISAIIALPAAVAALASRALTTE